VLFAEQKAFTLSDNYCRLFLLHRLFLLRRLLEQSNPAPGKLTPLEMKSNFSPRHEVFYLSGLVEPVVPASSIVAYVIHISGLASSILVSFPLEPPVVCYL
jgi:hypothetical protein